MQFLILGALEVHDDQSRPVVLVGGQQRALLAVLLLAANQPVAVERLIDLLWETAPSSARHAVHLLVHRLRRLLGAHGAADRLRTRNTAYLLQVEPGELDSDRFEKLLGEAAEEMAAGRPAGAVKRYDAALALWRGQPLGELGSNAFAQPAVTRLEELQVLAVAGRAEAMLATGRHIEAVPALGELVRRHPTQERLYRLLILALYRSGRQADALATYQSARQALVEQLGIEPGEELRELQRAVLAQDPSLWAPEIPAATAAPAATPSAAATTATTSAPAATSAAAGVTAAPGGGVTGATPAVGGQSVGTVHGANRPERRVVTILAVSLRTPRPGDADPDDADPEDLWTHSDQVAQQLRDVVEQHGGIVHGDLGETLLATFGTQRAYADDPARAVRAALALLDAGAGSPCASAVAVGIGVDTGEAIVHLPRPDAPPRVTGGVVHSATRLAAAAPAGAVRVGEPTVQVTDQVITYRPVELPGGQEQEAAVWEAADVVAAGAGAAGGEGEVVGRERELAMLTDVLDRARDELEPQLVTVIGTPGIGKTRLLAELRRRDGDGPAPATWYVGRSLPYGHGVTYWALAEIIKQITGIPPTDDAEAAERKLRQAVTAALGDPLEAVWVGEYLGRLIRPETTPDDDAGWRQGAFAAWCRYLEALADSGSGPLVLVFEDLQWADDPMLDFVEHLTGQAEAVPLLVVCVAWSELLDRRAGWAGGVRNATTISLAPLLPAATGQLLDQLLAAHEQQLDLDSARRAELLVRVGGNPLYVEEYVRMLRGRVPQAATTPGAPAAPDALLPPQTIQLLIGARLDDLAPGDRTLLADAAVLGETVWAGALAVVTGRAPDEVAAALRRLARREFLRRTPKSSIPGQVEYGFRHGLIRDVAYGRLLRADRAQRHQHAAQWLEALGPDRATDHAELIAHHYQQAVTYLRAVGQPVTDLAGRAATALRAAGDRALALASYRAALRYYTQALELHPTGQPGWASLMLTREQLRLELENRVEIASVIQARDLLLAEGDQGAAAVAQMCLCRNAWTRGQPGLATEHEQRTRALLREVPLSPNRALVLSELVLYMLRSNRHVEALELGREALTYARQLKLRKLEAVARCGIGTARVVFGDKAGVEELQHAVKILGEISSATLPRVCIHLYIALNHIGDLDAMRQGQAAIHRSAAHFDAKGLVVYAEVARATDRYLRGRWDDAHAIAEALIGQFQAAGGHYLETFCYCIRGKIRLARGDVTGASDDADRAYEVAEHADEHVLLPATGFRGSILHATGTQSGRDAAGRIAASVRDRLAGYLLTSAIGAELPALLAAYDQVPDIDDRLVRGSPWLQALYAFRDGRPESAAEIYAQIGDRADEAMARLHAGEHLTAAGRISEAGAQLGRARAFYTEVHATRCLDRITTLLSRHAQG